MKKQLPILALALFISGTLVLTGQNLKRQVLNLRPKSVSGIISNIKKCKAGDTIVLSGDPGAENWDRLLTALRKVEGLSCLEFHRNDLETLPSGVRELKNISSIRIRKNPLLELDSAIAVLKSLPNLSHLSIEIISIEDLPKNINELSGLSCLSLYQVNLQDESFGNEKYENEWVNEFVIIEYRLPFAFYDGSRKEMKVTYTGINAEEMREEMTWIGSFFPGTYDAEDRITAIGNSEKVSSEEVKSVFEKVYLNVKPPLKNVLVEKEYYAVSAVTGGTIETASGTTISIPANAFVDVNGKPVNNEVVVDYREFKDPVDFILSGIPMTYDSGGVMNTFESAGMFELNASSNGKEVFLAPGKKVDMEFTSTDSANSYNFYAFNDTKNNWDNIGKPGAAKVETKKKTELSKAYKFYKSYKYYTAWTYDTLTFDERFYHPEYSGEDKLKDGKEKRKHRNKTVRADRAIRVSAVTRNKKGEARFKIRHTSFLNPEMNAFNGVKWMLAEGENFAEFKQLFASKYFCDIRIQRSGGVFEIYVKADKEVKTFNAVPVEQDKNNKWVELADGGKKIYRHYNHILRARKKAFDRKLVSNKGYIRQREIHDPESFRRWLWSETKKRMNDSELVMNETEWIRYADRLYNMERTMLEKQEATINTITRSLSLSGFGIYNCDQIRRMDRPQEVFANYSDGKAKFDPARIYVMSKGVNAVFTYGKEEYMGYSAKKFALEKKKKSSILVLDDDGRLAVITPERIGEIGGSMNFLVEYISSEGLTADDLKRKMYQ